MPVPIPDGYSTVTPFLITDDADGLIGFVAAVLGGTEVAEARTPDDDGLLLHAELRVGDSTIAFADRKPGWPFTPGLLQVYVDDLDDVLEAARVRGAEVVTQPTPFFGATLARFVDPWRNLWWVLRQDEEVADWSEEAWAGESGDEWGGGSDPGLTYVHETLGLAMERVAGDGVR